MSLQNPRLIHRVQTRLMLMLVLSAAIIFGFLLLNRTAYQRDMNVLNEERLRERQTAFDEAFKARGSVLEGFALDYTFWDDMVNFVNGKTVDPVFSQDTLEPALDSYGANALWVYRIDGSEYYHVNNVTENSKPISLPLSEPRLLSLFLDNPVSVHRFVKTNDGTFELFLATIHPGNDQARETPSQGYFVVGKKIDETYLSDLSSQTISTVTLIEKSDADKYPVSFDFNSGKQAFRRGLEDLNGTTQQEFYVASFTPSVLQFAKSYGQLAVFYTVGFLLLLFGLALAVHLFIIKPLRRTSLALSTRNAADASRIARRHDEFGQIGGLIIESLNLSAQLRDEKLHVESKITERTRELREAQARLQASINSLESGFFMTSKDGTVTVSNPALIRIFDLGSRVTSALADHDEQIMSDMQEKLGDIFNMDAAIRKCLETGLPFNVQQIPLGRRFIRIYGAPIRIEGQDRAIGCVALVEDVTESLRLERSKDEFISIASHELRTPLTVIRGNASMLEELLDNPMGSSDSLEGKQMISDIRDSAVRLINIVNQFLVMSRLEQGRASVGIVQLQIAPILKAATEHLSTLATNKGLSIRSVISDDLPEVLADATRVEELATNLIGNAIKYTDHGSVTITAHRENAYVKVSVTDTGKGIPPENHDLLFRKFQQASSDILIRDDTRSTGLGLYICKLLVEQMHGKISLDRSVPNQGSTFSFTLPVAKTLPYDNGKETTKS